MAVSIDTVYQKVLMLANKEQRGYVTPQEFNLLADKAQLEIFDSYFHDLKMAYHKPTKNQLGVAFDEIEMLQEKLNPFKVVATITQVANDATMNIAAQNVYLIDNLLHLNRDVTELSGKEILYTQNNPLTAATIARSVYVRETNSILRLYPTPLVETDFDLHYWSRPPAPNWGYVVVRKRALYNNSTATNFSLHASEEENLVSRILQLAGVVIMKPGIVEIGAAEKAATKAEQNN